MKSTDSFDTEQEYKNTDIKDKNIHFFTKNYLSMIPSKIESDNVANRLDDPFHDIFLTKSII